MEGIAQVFFLFWEIHGFHSWKLIEKFTEFAGGPKYKVFEGD